MHSLINQQSLKTKKVFHPTTILLQHYRLGRGQVVQEPPIIGQSNLMHPYHPLNKYKHEASNQHKIVYTCIMAGY